MPDSDGCVFTHGDELVVVRVVDYLGERSSVRPHQEAIEPTFEVDTSNGFVVVGDDDISATWQLLNRLDPTVDVEFLE